MGKPAAKEGDFIQAIDTHIVMVPSPGGPVPTPTPHPFNGVINAGVSSNVRINGHFAAMKGSIAENKPAHMPIGGPSFQTPPRNQGQIATGSQRVRINQQPAARAGDTATTCDDVAPLAPKGTVVIASSQKPVLIGD